MNELRSRIIEELKAEIQTELEELQKLNAKQLYNGMGMNSTTSGSISEVVWKAKSGVTDTQYKVLQEKLAWKQEMLSKYE